VIGLILMIIIVLQILYRIRQRQKNDRRIFALEKKRAEDEIHNARQLLGSYVESLREKSQLIEKFKEEIQKLNTISENSSREQEEIEEKLHYATILTETDWIEFKRLFVKVHKNFFDVLNQKYPDLTQAETRLLALTKLKLTVSEMAHMLGISADSVRKTRLRLRKKLNLPEEVSLEDILD
jgi:DNA-binding CsgD family transcriptional regulator